MDMAVWAGEGVVVLALSKEGLFFVFAVVVAGQTIIDSLPHKMKINHC
jgi:hypothetical protein